MLTSEEKRKQIVKSRKNLIKELMYLESLGCETAVVMYDSETGTVNQYGSAKGAQFLMANETIPLKFMNFFDAANSSTKKYTNSDVRDLFNKKYSEACGKPGSRVPYLNGRFSVTGLPDGVEFSKPNNYGEDKIKKIMRCQESIAFHIEEKAQNQVVTWL
ncbi:general transcription factor II-I repeat domain-containing protein 1-like [Dendronephthya gigantea]|uniref:general transcription factor II-I repeat domain-containing protein 1-like n=1 Tax=Dendronephthya gigantea TaxID=151771 RepID=UPI00106B5160|nr:general transcription factor II-I repeat domain-containing protein 1-like [Dendronephthya gigantea]